MFLYNVPTLLSITSILGETKNSYETSETFVSCRRCYTENLTHRPREGIQLHKHKGKKKNRNRCYAMWNRDFKIKKDGLNAYAKRTLSALYTCDFIVCVGNTVCRRTLAAARSNRNPRTAVVMWRHEWLVTEEGNSRWKCAIIFNTYRTRSIAVCLMFSEHDWPSCHLSKKAARWSFSLLVLVYRWRGWLSILQNYKQLHATQFSFNRL
jgi:hypothetical protein